jgi:hypothetical protein
MIDPVMVIESVTSVTPLGVRFWDQVTGSAIGDGLSVASYTVAGSVRKVQTIDDGRQVVSVLARRVQAFPNRLGVYVLRNLPGLRTAEKGEGDADYWTSVQTRPYVIEVVDTYRRFQPFSFSADLPARGLFSLNCLPVSSPLDTTQSGVLLYSAPGRMAPGAMAMLHADLWDLDENAPAAWSVLEAHIAGQPPVRGFADLYGHVVLIFPYPEPVNTALSSPAAPLGTTTIPLIRQEWPVQLQAAYTRLSPTPTMPDLCAIFSQQAATLWMDSKQSQPFTGATLKFGQELVVRSKDHALPSRLLITPAVSPP